MAVAKKTTSKTTAAKSEETADAAAAPAPAVVTSPQPVVAVSALKKAELVDRVVLRSGVKKKYAKPVVEAALAVLGEALTNGEEYNLKPFGKMKINNQKEVSNALVYNVRIRRQKLEEPTETPIAASDETVDAAE